MPISNVGIGPNRPPRTQGPGAAAAVGQSTATRQGGTVSAQTPDGLPSAGISSSTPVLEKPGDVGGLAQALMQVRFKLSAEWIDSDKQAIKATGDSQKRINDERAKKIADAIDKMDKSSKSGTIGKVFGWVSAAALTVAGAALMAFGGAGAPLLVAGIAGLTMMTLQKTGAMNTISSALGKEMTKMFEAFGMSKSKAEMAGQIASQVAIAAVVIGVTTVATVASGGAAAGGEIAQIEQVAKIANVAARVAGGVSTAGAGAADISASVYQYKAALSRADATDLKQLQMQMQGVIQERLGNLKDDTENPQKLMAQVVKLITNLGESQDTIARRIGA